MNVRSSLLVSPADRFHSTRLDALLLFKATRNTMSKRNFFFLFLRLPRPAFSCLFFSRPFPSTSTPSSVLPETTLRNVENGSQDPGANACNVYAEPIEEFSCFLFFFPPSPLLPSLSSFSLFLPVIGNAFSNTYSGLCHYACISCISRVAKLGSCIWSTRYQSSTYHQVWSTECHTTYVRSTTPGRSTGHQEKKKRRRKS